MVGISASDSATRRDEWSRTETRKRTDWCPSVSGLANATIRRTPASCSFWMRERTVASLTSSSAAIVVLRRRPSFSSIAMMRRSISSIIPECSLCWLTCAVLCCGGLPENLLDHLSVAHCGFTVRHEQDVLETDSSFDAVFDGGGYNRPGGLVVTVVENRCRDARLSEPRRDLAAGADGVVRILVFGLDQNAHISIQGGRTQKRGHIVHRPDGALQHHSAFEHKFRGFGGTFFAERDRREVRQGVFRPVGDHAHTLFVTRAGPESRGGADNHARIGGPHSTHHFADRIGGNGLTAIFGTRVRVHHCGTAHLCPHRFDRDLVYGQGDGGVLVTRAPAIDCSLKEHG